MNKTLIEAFTVVLDLAAENTIDPREDETEYKRQDSAITLVENYLEEIIKKGA